MSLVFNNCIHCGAPSYDKHYPWCVLCSPTPDCPDPKPTKVYIAGALKNARIPEITKALLKNGFDAFSEWYTPGPDADVLWRDYELALGFNYREALARPSAQNTFNFDKRYIDQSDVMLMVLPCGKSAHMELGYMIGTGKPGYILMEDGEPDRWDVMYNYATQVCYTLQEFIEHVRGTV